MQEVNEKGCTTNKMVTYKMGQSRIMEVRRKLIDNKRVFYLVKSNPLI
jgi:hypothetical protein